MNGRGKGYRRERVSIAGNISRHAQDGGDGGVVGQQCHSPTGPHQIHNNPRKEEVHYSSFNSRDVFITCCTINDYNRATTVDTSFILCYKHYMIVSAVLPCVPKQRPATPSTLPFQPTPWCYTTSNKNYCTYHFQTNPLKQQQGILLLILTSFECSFFHTLIQTSIPGGGHQSAPWEKHPTGSSHETAHFKQNSQGWSLKFGLGTGRSIAEALPPLCFQSVFATSARKDSTQAIEFNDICRTQTHFTV